MMIQNHPWDISVPKRILRSTIKNAPYHPREIKSKAKKRLENGMDALKLLGPLNWNERSGNLIGGHQRISILDMHADGGKDYYLQVAAVDLSPEDEVAANLLLNNAEAQGDWNVERTIECFKTDGLKIDATGFSLTDVFAISGDDVFASNLTSPYPEQFTLFESECFRLAELWGIQISVVANWTSRSSNEACCFYNPTNGIMIDCKLDKLATMQRDQILSLARHEMIHALLEPFNWLASTRASERKLDSANHEILRRLDPLLPT